ncbi:hypothetical protein J415_18345 [Klebsiella michiganensis HKOPL1]|nr:hypothetical protein J415_18345 [Klebsiella michiganensis HKOPL1]
MSEHVQGDKFQIDMEEFRAIQAYQQARLSDMFPGERMQQVACSSGERHTLRHDFIIVKRVYYNDKIQIGVFIKSAMNKRAAREQGVNPGVRLNVKLELLCKTSV